MIFLFETGQNFRKEFRNVFWTFLDDSDGSKKGFFSDVSTVVTDALEHLIMKLSGQFSGTYFTNDTQNQTNDTVVRAGQVDSESVGCHH